MDKQVHDIVLKSVAFGVLVLALTDTALIGQHWFERINREVTLALHSGGNRAFDYIMTFFTITGSDVVLFTLALSIAAWLWKLAKRWDAMVLLSSTLSARILVLLVKVIVGSPRPFINPPPWPL